MKLLNTLFEITIYSAVLFAAVTGFKLAFKNKLSPALHFTLWFLVIARLCIPMTIESGFHLFTVEQEKPLVQQQIPEVSAFDAPTPAATREAAPSEALRSEAPAPVQDPPPIRQSLCLQSHRLTPLLHFGSRAWRFAPPHYCSAKGDCALQWRTTPCRRMHGRAIYMMHAVPSSALRTNCRCKAWREYTRLRLRLA